MSQMQVSWLVPNAAAAIDLIKNVEAILGGECVPAAPASAPASAPTKAAKDVNGNPAGTRYFVKEDDETLITWRPNDPALDVSLKGKLISLTADEYKQSKEAQVAKLKSAPVTAAEDPFGGDTQADTVREASYEDLEAFLKSVYKGKDGPALLNGFLEKQGVKGVKALAGKTSAQYGALLTEAESLGK